MTKREIIVAPSILSGDFANMGHSVKQLEEWGGDYVHCDVMDGVYVNNITFGMPMIAALRKITDKTLDVHLMITDPLKYIDDFANAGADIITFHVECDSPIDETIEKIKSRGIKVGLVIKPKTPASAVFPYLDKLDLVLVMTVEPGFGGQSFMADMLPKVTQIKDECKKRGLDLLVEADGGIGEGTIAQAAAAGVDVCVAGTAVFKADDAAQAIEKLKSLCK